MGVQGMIPLNLWMKNCSLQSYQCSSSSWEQGLQQQGPAQPEQRAWRWLWLQKPHLLVAGSEEPLAALSRGPVPRRAVRLRIHTSPGWTGLDLKAPRSTPFHQSRVLREALEVSGAKLV